MERKSYLVGFTLLLTAIILCINWYAGLNTYSLEEDITQENTMTYEEALVWGKEQGVEINVDKQYYLQRRLIINNRKTKIPLVFEKDTLFSEAKYFSRDKG